MDPDWPQRERSKVIRLPNLTPAIALRLRSLSISPPCYEESHRWHKWVDDRNLHGYSYQVSLGRLEYPIPHQENVILDWSDRDVSHTKLHEILCILDVNEGEVTKDLRRLEIHVPGDWTKLIPSLKNTLLQFEMLKYFSFHLAECYPPLCLSREALKRDKHFKKMVDLAEDFAEVQPSLHFVEVNYFLYQVIRWSPGRS